MQFRVSSAARGSDPTLQRAAPGPLYQRGEEGAVVLTLGPTCVTGDREDSLAREG